MLVAVTRSWDVPNWWCMIVFPSRHGCIFPFPGNVSSLVDRREATVEVVIRHQRRRHRGSKLDVNHWSCKVDGKYDLRVVKWMLGDWLRGSCLLSIGSRLECHRCFVNRIF